MYIDLAYRRVFAYELTLSTHVYVLPLLHETRVNLYKFVSNIGARARRNVSFFPDKRSN